MIQGALVARRDAIAREIDDEPRRTVVRQRHVAHAEREEHTQARERVVDLVATLDAHQRGDAPLRELAAHVVRARREREHRGVLGDEPPHDINLLERRLFAVCVCVCVCACV